MSDVQPSATGAPPPPRRRWGRRILWGLLGLLGLVLLVVGGVLVYLTSPAGESWLRAQVVPLANEQLSGRLEVGGVELGLGSVVLTDLKLYTPEGALVAEVARVEAHMALGALSRQVVDIRSALVRQPRLYLVQDARGLNLARALAPRTPSPPDEPGPRGRLRVELRELLLEDGFVEYEQDTDGTTLQVHLEDFDARARARYAAATQSFEATVDATGGLAQPVRGPVKLSVKGQGQEDAFSGDVSLSVAGLELEARADMPRPDELRAEVRRLVVPPALARGFVPAYPLQVPVSAQGTASLSGNVAQAELDARAGSTTLEVKGDFNLATWRSTGLTAKARGVNLAELMENGPPTSLSADLSARGGGMSLESLDAAVELNVSPSRFKGQPLGPVELRTSAKEGRFNLTRLRALVPGASLSANGGGTLENIQVKGSLSAGDLATLARTLGALGASEPLPLSGSGSLEFSLSGPARTPGLKLAGHFATLAWADTLLERLSLKADVPDVTRPFSTDATLVVERLRTGGRTFQDVTATVTTGAQRALEAQVRVQGDAQLALSLEGTVDENGKGLAVEALTVAYPKATWTLRHPTHLGFGEAVEVAPALTLDSGEQSLAVELRLRGERLDARANVRALELSLLPRLFVPESLGLGGRLSASVVARGRLPRPDAEVDLTLTDGRFQEYSPFAVELKGRYVRDRATGTLSAQTQGASATADFNIPVQGVLRRRREPVELVVNLTHLDIGALLEAARRPETYRGQLTGRLEVKGMARDPLVTLNLLGQALRDEGPDAIALPRPLSFELNAGSDPADGTLDARVEVQGIGSTATLALETPLTAGQLLARTPTPAELMEMPVTLRARLDAVPLSHFAGASRLRRLGGHVSLRLDAAGSARAPTGELELDARGVTMSGIPPLDGRLTVDATGPEVRAELTANRQQQRLAQLSALLRAPLAALQDPEVISRVPFELQGRVGPVALRELPMLRRTAAQQGIQGDLALELSASGTPEAPRVDVLGGLQKLGVGELALGQARMHYQYADERSTLDALLTSPSGGSLLLRADTRLNLSLPALQRGLQTADMPLDAELVARGFDMSFLSGATPTVRTLGGVLRADAKVSGTPRAPTLRGEVEWKDGRLGLAGLGEYRDIHLALSATEERVRLQELFARAGAGELRMSADAVLTRGGDFALTGQAQTEDFPIIYEDQLLAIATLRAQMEGDVSSTLVHLRNLSIPEATIELPEVRRKDLQPLDRPGDVVLVRNGVPVDRRRRRAMQRAEAEKKAESKPTERPRGQPEASEEAPRRYVVNVNAPRNLWVRGADVNVELGLSEDFRVEYDEEARLYGEVRVLRGQVDVLSRHFEVQRGSQVRFTGPPRTPYINATAEHRNERENVTVFVTIRGQGKEFTFKPTSEPPLPETDIYTLLATGRRSLRTNSGASMTGTQQAASIVGSLVASQARKVISEKLPLDVFTFEALEGGLGGARLEVGTYVSDQIYVGYQGRVGAASTSGTAQRRESTNAVRLEYQFGPRWGLEAQCGDAPACGFDLIWGRDY